MTEKVFQNNQAVVAGEVVSGFTFSHELYGEGFYNVDLRWIGCLMHTISFLL